MHDDGMTGCPDDETLHSLMAGTLSAADDTVLTGHLGQCTDCQQRFDQMTGPDGFVDRVARAVSERCDGTILDQALQDLAGHADATPSDSSLTSVSDTLNPLLEQGTSEVSPFGDVEKWFDQVDTSGSSPSPYLHGYEILDFIGRGGMGVVFRARDPSLNRIVALKVLSPSRATDPLARERFLREARAAASINHECVATVHAVVDRAGLPCLVMEYVNGESLRQRLDSTPVLRLKDIVTVSSQVTSGVTAAHACGIVHRDLKPANILLTTGEPTRVRLTDFGLARVAEDDSLTQSGMLAGTPGYIAPEVAQGHKADYRSDLFSFGCLLYVISTGQSPFPASTTIEFLQSVTQHEPIPVRQLNATLPTWLNDLITSLLQKNPKDRPKSAAAVKRILHRAYRQLRNPSTKRPLQEPSLPAQGSPVHPADPRKGRWLLSSTVGRWIAVSGIAVAILCTALAMRPDRTSPDRTSPDQPPPVVTSTAPSSQTAVRAQQESRQNSPATIPSASPPEAAFLVTTNEKPKRFRTLERAVEKADDGSTIVIASPGPFETAGIAPSQDELTITAAAGCVPVLRLVPDIDDDAPDLFAINTQLTLQGLELHVDETNVTPDALLNLGLIRILTGELHAKNCRLTVPAGGQCVMATEPTEVRFDRCALHVPHGSVISWEAGVEDRVILNDCIITADMLAHIHGTPDQAITLNLRHNTVLARTVFAFDLEQVPRSHRSQVRAAAEDCVFACDVLCRMNTGIASTFKQRITWKGHRNVYATPFVALHSDSEPIRGPDSFSAWAACSNVTEQNPLVSRVMFRTSRDALRLRSPDPEIRTFRDFTFTTDDTLPSQSSDEPGAHVEHVGPGQRSTY